MLPQSNLGEYLTVTVAPGFPGVGASTLRTGAVPVN